jgi:hypothetical protein
MTAPSNTYKPYSSAERRRTTPKALMVAKNSASVVCLFDLLERLDKMNSTKIGVRDHSNRNAKFLGIFEYRNKKARL